MAGSGKTNLVTEVGKKAEGLKLFDQVLSITLSQTPNIKEIQGKLAGMLNMKLEAENEDVRSQRLWMSLKQKKRLLVIVDDLWGEFMLRKVGICLDSDYKGIWKVLVTTCRREVCNTMDCQKNIHLGLLSEQESWTLFKVQANINDSFSKSLDDVPQKICVECERLPIAIVTVGRSLKRKCEAEWQVALDCLNHSQEPDYVQEGVGATFKVLKWSYDYLKTSEEKLLFLICSLFPEDYKIKIEDLIRYAIGLNLGGRHLFKSARSRIKLGLNKLIDCSLLMQDEERKGHVYMHDLFRDLALWIAKRSEDHKILVNLDKPIGALAEDVKVTDYFAVSSWFQECQISLQWDAPNLQIMLLVTYDGDSMDLSQAKFEGITRLKVLSVISNDWISRSLLSLPQSMKLLTNLRTLCLNGWCLGDISFIGYLTSLEVLHLENCRLKELPNEMGKLKRLKLLDLSSCHFEDGQYNGALWECAQVEELYFTECYPGEYFIKSLVDIATLPNLHRFELNSDSLPYDLLVKLKEESRRVVDLRDVDLWKVGTSKNYLLQELRLLF